MARVTGIGGVFLRARDPKALSAWYAQHLHFEMHAEYGANFLWSDAVPAGTGSTAFCFFPEKTSYFGTSGQQAMINLRVDNLDEMLKELTAGGVAIDPVRQEYSYGHFAWITDPEGNRVELWQPLPKPPKES
jgi:predicted enzyme related to lactoylglutathione lyase